MTSHVKKPGRLYDREGGGIEITLIPFISFKGFRMENTIIVNDTTVTNSIDVTRDIIVTTII